MKYTDSHEWVKITGRDVVVGVTDFAQDELGEIVFIELPKIGKSVKAGDELAVLESTKAAADVYAPVSGEIVSVNEKLKDEPQLINESAEDAGWIVKLRLTSDDGTDKLLSLDEYKKITGQ